MHLYKGAGVCAVNVCYLHAHERMCVCVCVCVSVSVCLCVLAVQVHTNCGVSAVLSDVGVESSSSPSLA
jgi:hypothetical protein